MNLMAYLKAGFIPVVNIREDKVASYVADFTGFDDVNVMVKNKPSYYYYIDGTLFFREV